MGSKVSSLTFPQNKSHFWHVKAVIKINIGDIWLCIFLPWICLCTALEKINLHNNANKEKLWERDTYRISQGAVTFLFPWLLSIPKMIFSVHISNEIPCHIAKNGLIDSCIAIRSARLQCRSLIPECALVHMAYVACSSALSEAVNIDLCKGQSCTAYGCSRLARDCGLRACAKRHSLDTTSGELHTKSTNSCATWNCVETIATSGFASPEHYACKRMQIHANVNGCSAGCAYQWGKPAAMFYCLQPAEVLKKDTKTEGQKR